MCTWHWQSLTPSSHPWALGRPQAGLGSRLRQPTEPALDGSCSHHCSVLVKAHARLPGCQAGRATPIPADRRTMALPEPVLPRVGAELRPSFGSGLLPWRVGGLGQAWVATVMHGELPAGGVHYYRRVCFMGIQLGTQETATFQRNLHPIKW